MIASLFQLTEVLNGFALATGAQPSFALPDKTNQIIWQTSYPVAPGAITVLLQTSIDNTNWTTLDTSTNVNGETRIINTSAPYARINISSLTIGSGTLITVGIYTSTGLPASSSSGAASHVIVDSGTVTANAGVPSLGQALAAGSLPVVLTAAQITTLTPITPPAFPNWEVAPVANDFCVHNIPAVNTQATITRASAGAGNRNVCTGFTVTIATDATPPTALQLSVSLIDGVSGGSTYLWRSNISVPAIAGATISISKSFTKPVKGSQATAMTLEFSAAAGADTWESVSLQGTSVTE